MLKTFKYKKFTAQIQPNSTTHLPYKGSQPLTVCREKQCIMGYEIQKYYVKFGLFSALFQAKLKM